MKILIILTLIKRIVLPMKKESRLRNGKAMIIGRDIKTGELIIDDYPETAKDRTRR